jgi:hypothetical protein
MQTPAPVAASAASAQFTTPNAFPMLSAVKKQEQFRAQQQQQQQAQQPEKEPARKVSVTVSPHFVYTPPSATRIRARVFGAVCETMCL